MVDDGGAGQSRPRGGTDGGGRIVLILGMHRSGTSLLARLLAAEGLPLGPMLLNQRSRDNRHGYWEQGEIVAIHEALLDGFDRTWHGRNALRPLPEGWLEAAATAAARRRLTEIVSHEMRAARGLWGFKDPRTLRFLPLWRAVIAELGLTPVFILAARAPGAVAASLMRRNRLSRDFAEAVWAANTVELLLAEGAALAAAVDYDRWFARPEATLAHLRRVIGLGGAGLAPAEIRRLIDPALRHHAGDRAGAHPAFQALHEALVAQAPLAPAVAPLAKLLAEAKVALQLRQMHTEGASLSSLKT